MGVVLAAAAVLSFDGLQGLALTVRIPAHLAWLLPIVVDAGAAVSCATWLGGRSSRDAARYAGRMTWSLLATTVIGNAGHLGMVAENITPPWWVAVLVGAIAPAVVGSTVHLVVLLTRRGPAVETAVQTTETSETTPETTPPANVDELLPQVLEWARSHDGTPSQRQLRSQFSVGADRARKLMEQMEAAA